MQTKTELYCSKDETSMFPFSTKINFFLFQQGLRNSWPYVYPFTRLGPDGQPLHLTRPTMNNYEIAVNPVLRARLYCIIYNYPNAGPYSLICLPGNHSFWGEILKSFPLAMLRNNIPQTVFNAILAFLSLLLGIFGKYYDVLAK